MIPRLYLHRIHHAFVILLNLSFLVGSAFAQSGQELLPQHIIDYSFGSGVAIDGDVAAISGGAPVRHPTFNSDVPSIDMYRFIDSTWVFEGNLISDDPVFWNKIGSNVFLEDNLVLVGTPATANGAVLDFTFDGASWVERGRTESTSNTSLRDNFGFFLSMRDGVLVAGDNDDWDGFNRRQYAYIYRNDGSGWQFEDSLTTGEVNDDIGFGVSVAASNNVVVVGAPFYSVGQTTTREGAAYVYEYTGSEWVETQMLMAGAFTIPDARFGQSVATDGNTIVVGAVRDSVDGVVHAGASYIFRKEGGTWTLKQRLVASTVEAYANFGIVAAISDDRLVIGAPTDTRFENAGGSAYVYKYNGVAWVEGSRLILPDPVENDRFGTSVAIDGEWVIVGAPGRQQGDWKPGAAYIFPAALLVSTEESIDLKPGIHLSPVYPNPFTGLAKLALEIPSAQHVRLDVYDLLGRRVDTVLDTTLPTGRHEYTWNSGSLASGVYFFRLDTAQSIVTVKGVLANGRW